MNKIIPTIFATNKRDFDKRFDKLIKLQRDLQIDIMDGKFVNSKSIDIEEIPDLKKYNLSFEVHLMTLNPERYIDELEKRKIKKVIFHYESYWNILNCISLSNEIKARGMLSYIALNPETSISKIISFLSEFDGVLLMGHITGVEHKSLVLRTYDKIRAIRKVNHTIPIQIDGGVSIENIEKLRNSGADIFTSGSFIFESKNPEKALKEMENI